MPMIVKCGSCGSRFQMDEALLKGARGARIRCRVCGSPIVLMKNPRASEEPAPKKIPRVEDLFLPSPGAAAERASLSTDPARRPHVARGFLLFAIALMFLAAAGAMFFHRPSSVDPMPHASTAAGDAGSPAYEVRDVKGRWSLLKDDQSIYVIRGTVANVGKTPSEGIRILATLLDADRRLIAESGAFAGNLIDETLLPHMNAARIQEFLGLRYGERNTNREIPVGGFLPFMVVFSNPPAEVGSFSVRAVDAEGVETPLGPGSKSADAHVSVPGAFPPN